MEEVDVYIQVVLPALDVYIMEWDPQYMIQVDGRTPVLRMLEVSFSNFCNYNNGILFSFTLVSFYI